MNYQGLGISGLGLMVLTSGLLGPRVVGWRASGSRVFVFAELLLPRMEFIMTSCNTAGQGLGTWLLQSRQEPYSSLKEGLEEFRLLGFRV